MSPRIGLREKNKREKLRRIKAAAYALFSEKGFDDATVSEIARRARVGFGTCFAYARDKRDLLFLLYSDELAEINEVPFTQVDRSVALVDQLIAIFRPNYELFEHNPSLSRILLREWTFMLGGSQSSSSVPDRSSYVARLAGLIANAKADGHVTADAPSTLIAEMLYSTYTGAVRQWLRAERPTAADGIATLRAMLELQATGIAR